MSFVAVAIGGASVGLIGGVGKMVARGKANKKLNELQSQDPTYQSNPLVAQRLGLANTLLNARMPGAAQAGRNIQTAGANTLAGTQRNATSGAQALAMGTAVNAQQGQQFNDLAQQETQDYQRRYGNLVGAQEAAVNEDQNVFQDEVRRFGNKSQIQGAIAQNKASNWGDLSKMGFGIADFGMSGGFGGMGGGGGGGMAAGMTPQSYSPQMQSYGGMPQQTGGINPNYMPYMGGFNPYNNKALNG